MISDPTTRIALSPNRYTDGNRNVDWIVVHTQQGRGKARDLVPYLQNPAPGGNPNAAVSYNAVVDDVETVLVVPWGDSPWSAMNANRRADHIVLAGSFVEWTPPKWVETDASDGLNEDAMLTCAAVLVAWRCQQRGIPMEYVGTRGKGPLPADRGIVGHADFGKWGGGHTDPEPNFPWTEFIRRVRAAAAIAGGLMALTPEQDIKAQLTGSPEPGKYPGWPQLGSRTLVDAVAALCAKNGVSGCYDPKEKK
ncbi:N-acetylmuramoyl-L-alanine amidase [Gordonia sp. (in: high G+C Gram-positive bacteria)]|uniref:peptidoglycan recognition protein family protein n=1 Tax=Gordonia sp. (in: high G+C Gram-positive bacteria) TaxID=84139 RepID=UPI0039E479DB